jgi:hypothetical protein
MGDVFVGIVEGPSPHTITVGIVQDGTRITGAAFAVEPAHLHEYYVPQADGRHRYEMPPDLFQFGQFLNKTIPPGPRTRYLFEVPQAIRHPPDAYDAVPHPILPADSVILKVLVLLGVSDQVTAPFQADPQVQTAVLFPILRDTDLAHLRDRSPRYLPRGICRAYGELLGLTCERPEHVAIVGALIAKNPGAFHYWSSIGRVQSSGDVLADLRHGGSGPTSVLSGAETYVTDYTAATVRDAIEEVPLEYAVTEKRYQHLGPNDAIKAALIHVCRQWRIDLRCSSQRADANDPDTEHPVYPLPLSDSLLIGALQHAEREGIWPEPA